MRILVIGNGYDKMHALNTGYKDFLDFVNFILKHTSFETDEKLILQADAESVINFCIQQIHLWKNGVNSNMCKNEDAKWYKMVSNISVEHLVQFILLVRQSFWVKYFNKRRDLIGDKWMNFEAELEFVVKEVFDGNNANRMIQCNDIANKELASFIIKEKGRYEIYGKELEDLMYEEYEKLLKILDYYMSFIDKVDVFSVPQIDNCEYDKVISFNYTHTYKRIKEIQNDNDICYIHGETGVQTPPQIVLGFDDHYFDENKITIPQHIKYEKYYLRIVKKTDSQYFEWFRNAEQENQFVIDIVGHSLSPADGDIIKRLIMLPNSYIIIYYMDDNDRAEKIKNLAIILGAEKLITLTNGMDERVIFVKLNVPKREDLSNTITS